MRIQHFYVADVDTFGFSSKKLEVNMRIHHFYVADVDTFGSKS